MKSEQWKVRIEAACTAVGTYKPCFDYVIQTLSDILEKRDEAQELYISTNSKPIVAHKNKAHETNMVRNPILVVWTELNAQALAYWRDLGLTPAGLKKINEDAVVTKKTSALSKALKELGG